MTGNKRHTPGPWAYYHPSEFPDDWRIARAGRHSAGRTYIGRVTTSHGPEMSGDGGGGLQPPREEDVRIMARAPELVYMLKTWVADHDEFAAKDPASRGAKPTRCDCIRCIDARDLLARCIVGGPDERHDEQETTT